MKTVQAQKTIDSVKNVFVHIELEDGTWGIGSGSPAEFVTGEDNLNTLYLYNYVRGELKNIPGVADGSGKIFVNGKNYEDYFKRANHKMQLLRPFDIINLSLSIQSGLLGSNFK